jgi:hypothetical protein
VSNKYHHLSDEEVQRRLADLLGRTRRAIQPLKEMAEEVVLTMQTDAENKLTREELKALVDNPNEEKDGA